MRYWNCVKFRPNWFWLNPELVLFNMFSPTFLPNVVTLPWKTSLGMPKESGWLNGPLCAYLMRQNPHNQTRSRSFDNECPHQVWKWSVKNYGRQSVDFNVWSWKMRKKSPNFFWRFWKSPELMLFNMFSPTFVPNFVALAWKMSPWIPKESGSLNGPLCTY